MEIKMNWTDFSSKNPRSRQMCFYFLSNDEMSKLRKKMSTIQSKDENCVRRSEAHAWAPPVTLPDLLVIAFSFPIVAQSL